MMGRSRAVGVWIAGIVVTSMAGVAEAGDETARLQVIHNAADPSAASVDVYINDAMEIDDFAFRTATPFLDVPAGVDLEIGVAPGDSKGPADILARFPVNLIPSETYVAIASGVVDPTEFEANPNGREIDFTLLVKSGARESSTAGSAVDFFGVHGSTDAPTVDIVARGVATLVDDASYSDISDYVSVPPQPYLVDVKPGSDDSIVATFDVDLTGLGGASAVVFASGFLDPSSNQDGSAFGLLAALPNGDVVEFPLLTTARVQIIHNSADPAAEMVDVSLDGDVAIPDFKFRSATEFLDFPANQLVEVGVSPSDDATAGGAFFDVNFPAGGTFIVIASGVLEPGDFAPNPEGRDTAFTLLVKEQARETGLDEDSIDLFVIHGATDAPAVRVLATPGGEIVPAAAYGDMTDYLSIPDGRYRLYVRTLDGNVFVAGYLADLRGLAGGAATVFASGFLDPSQNQDGEAFGIFAATADGGVIELPLQNPFATLRGADRKNGKGPKGLSSAVPRTELALDRSFPNPFTTETTIGFRLPNAGPVQLRTYDISGRVVSVLVDETLPAGDHSVNFSPDSDLSSGVYFYELRTPDGRRIERMTLSR